MKVKPLFTATIGKNVFNRNIVGDYPEETVKFLQKCKLNDGSDAYPMEIQESKKVKPAVLPDTEETTKKNRGVKKHAE